MHYHFHMNALIKKKKRKAIFAGEALIGASVFLNNVVIALIGVYSVFPYQNLVEQNTSDCQLEDCHKCN